MNRSAGFGSPRASIADREFRSVPPTLTPSPTDTGRLALNSSAASFSQLTALINPFAPAFVARLNAMGGNPGPARAKLALELEKSGYDRFLKAG